TQRRLPMTTRPGFRIRFASSSPASSTPPPSRRRRRPLLEALEERTLLTTSATHFAITDFPTSTTVGQAQGLTVTALDASDKTVQDSTGTVEFSSSDSRADLPSAYTFTSGSGGDDGKHTFLAILNTAGSSQSITATDMAVNTITGTE